MLTIKNLSVSVEGKEILKDLSLDIKPGHVHAIMGPNGAGKSTLSSVLAGNPGYEITSGSVEFDGQDLLEMKVEERANTGLFIGFQNPIEIPGVTLVNFLKAAVDAQAKAREQKPPSSVEFLQMLKSKVEFLGLPNDFYRKTVNANLSGGQKKLSELLQLSVLEPKLAILDEIDSGLDIDAVKLVANNLNKLHSNDRSFILITHYQRILNFLTPDYVHVLKEGRIVKSGGQYLVEEIEAHGYDQFN